MTVSCQVQHVLWSALCFDGTVEIRSVHPQQIQSTISLDIPPAIPPTHVLPSCRRVRGSRPPIYTYYAIFEWELVLYRENPRHAFVCTVGLNGGGSAERNIARRYYANERSIELSYFGELVSDKFPLAILAVHIVCIA